MGNFISKKRIQFNEKNKNTTELDLLKDISFQLQELNLNSKNNKIQNVKNQRNTFNIFLIILIPMILSIIGYIILFLI